MRRQSASSPEGASDWVASPRKRPRRRGPSLHAHAMRQPAPATGAVWSARATAGMNGTPTWSCGLLASVAGTALLFLAEQPANGGLDALLLGGFMQRVLATVTAAGVAHGAVL